MKTDSPWLKWLIDPLSGKTSLGRAFWLYGLVGSIVFLAIGLLFPPTPVGLGVYGILSLIVGILQTVILWRCAPNARSALVRRLVRLIIVAGLILAPVVVYLYFAYAEYLTLDNL